MFCVDNFFIGSKCNVVYFIGCFNFELFWYDVIFLFYVEVDCIFNFVCFVLLVYY